METDQSAKIINISNYKHRRSQDPDIVPDHSPQGHRKFRNEHFPIISARIDAFENFGKDNVIDIVTRRSENE